MKKIAFFDSGIGGLTVLHKALQIMPNEPYLYFSDAQNAPYGTKSSKDIKKLVFDAVDFLIQQDIKALVLACNTATSVAIKDLRQQYNLPIIGMEPAVKPAVESAKDKKILVCATDKTLAENKLKLLIENLNATTKVEQLSLQELVLFAEKFQFDDPKIERYLKEVFSGIQWNDYDSIVLGCTHFPYFTPNIRRLLPPHIRILDGHTGTVKHLQARIVPSTQTSPSPIQYFCSKKASAAKHFEKYFAMLNQQVSL
ncbi:glutamate racemase [Aureispira anguillae]|uniref:Glutamate racemase n=1 Tax=Aureispira anguillae TaxID=2864201 RepID=A0A915VJZ6_9BACT|nr:glutamate racemase [Aureispira anguillae]BDS09386.1 glutamate racemase [Aureispira anguillae]